MVVSFGVTVRLPALCTAPTSGEMVMLVAPSTVHSSSALPPRVIRSGVAVNRPMIISGGRAVETVVRAVLSRS